MRGRLRPRTPGLQPDSGNQLLPPQAKEHEGKICKRAQLAHQSAALANLVGMPGLVLDLDETLVHSSFKPVPNADFVVPIEIDGQSHHVYVLKRPFVDQFLKAMEPLFEVPSPSVHTASPS